MSELDDESAKLFNDFQKICIRFNENERSNKELSTIVNHQKKSTEVLKENEKKDQEQIKSLRKICTEQTKRISELYDLERKSEKLNNEKKNLEILVQKLQNEISAIETSHADTIKGYNLTLINKEKEMKILEKQLMEKLEALQAGFDLELSEKENKEQSLKSEIYELNNQYSSSTAILQKKIYELEQKLKNLEREKSLFSVSQGNFVSANNVLRGFPKDNQPPQNYESSQNQEQHNTSFTKNVSKIIEKNTAQKFNFRKKHRSSNQSVERVLLSETFDPFEMHKQMNANSQKRKENDDKQDNLGNSSRYESYVINDYSEDSYNSQQEYKSKNTTQIDEYENTTISEQDKKENYIKRVSPGTKKRKLFDPKNTDYLN